MENSLLDQLQQKTWELEMKYGIDRSKYSLYMNSRTNYELNIEVFELKIFGPSNSNIISHLLDIPIIIDESYISGTFAFRKKND